MKQKRNGDQTSVQSQKEPAQMSVSNRAKLYTYDPTQRSWLGPKSNSSSAPTLVTQRISTREKQMKQQQQAHIKVNKKKLPRVDSPNLEEDEDDVDGAPKEPLPVGNQPSRVEQPQADEHPEVSWTPAIINAEKNPRLVSFERPMTDKTEHFMSTNQQIQRLESELDHKNNDVTLLRQQLLKSHRENDKLVQQLNMYEQEYSGADYKEIVHENQQMKEIIQRMHRTVIKLEGEKKRDENTKLQQIKFEEELEELHMRDWYHPTSTAKDEQYAVNTSLNG